MANIFNYGLVGVGSTVQFGKSNGRIAASNTQMELQNADNTARLHLLANNGDFDGTMTIEGNTTISTGNFLVDAGTATFDGNATFNALAFLTDGTAAAPALAFTSANDTGLYAASADSLGLAVNGAASVIVNAATAASVAQFQGSTSIVIPSGNDAARPAGATGMIRMNTQTSTNYVEYWDGDSWESVGGLSFVTFTVAADGGSATGGPVVADDPNDTLTLNAGVGIDLTADATNDSIEVSFTRTGLAPKTTPVLADTVALFDSASSNAPSYASFTQIFGALDVVNGITANGILVRTADDTYASRSIAVDGPGPLAGLSVVNGDGVSGNPTVGLDISGTTALVGTIADDDLFVMWDQSAGSDGANVAVTALQIQEYAVAAVDPLVRRAAGVTVDNAVNISTPLPSTTNVYVTRIVINVTSPATGGSNGTITDGTNTLVAAGDWDWNTAGIYVIELPLAVNSTGDQLAFAFTSAPSSAGTATVTAEYKIAA